MQPSAVPSKRSPQEQISEIVVGHWQSRALAVVTELEIADVLADGPLGIDALSEKTKTHAPSLFRLLRSLEGIGIFQQVSPGLFANTPTSDCLRKNVPNSQWAWVLFTLATDGMVFRGWTGLGKTVENGKIGFDQVEGCGAWEYMQGKPEKAALFNRAMQAVSAGMTEAVTAAYDWSRYEVIADIAGGIGTQLVSILDAHPSSRGILFDQPQAIEQAIPHERIERVGGDFFANVPEGADAYILRWIIHDWADAEATHILKNVRAALKPGASVLLVESVLSDDTTFDLAKWMDLNMMVMAGGQERTASEYADLFATTGFALDRIIDTNSPLSLIIGRPA